MTQEEVNKHWKEKCLPELRIIAKYKGVEYTDDIDYIASKAYGEACSFAYNKAFEEANNKNLYEVLHHVLVDIIIDEVDRHGGSVELKDGYYVKNVGLINSPVGIFPQGGFIKNLETKGHGLIFDVPEIGFIMSNELSFIELLNIYKLIP